MSNTAHSVAEKQPLNSYYLWRPTTGALQEYTVSSLCSKNHRQHKYRALPGHKYNRREQCCPQLSFGAVNTCDQTECMFNSCCWETLKHFKSVMDGSLFDYNIIISLVLQYLLLEWCHTWQCCTFLYSEWFNLNWCCSVCCSYSHLRTSVNDFWMTAVNNCSYNNNSVTEHTTRYTLTYVGWHMQQVSILKHFERAFIWTATNSNTAVGQSDRRLQLQYTVYGVISPSGRIVWTAHLQSRCWTWLKHLFCPYH